MTCKILRLFANTLTADDKYCLLSTDNLIQTIQMDLSQNEKSFSEFFCAFFNRTSNFEYFQKKMMVIAHVFPKFQSPKDVVR